MDRDNLVVATRGRRRCAWRCNLQKGGKYSWQESPDPIIALTLGKDRGDGHKLTNWADEQQKQRGDLGVVHGQRRAVSLTGNKELMEAEGDKDMAWKLCSQDNGSVCACKGRDSRKSAKQGCVGCRSSALFIQ